MPALLRPGVSETWAQPQREALESVAQRPQGHRPGADIVPLRQGLAWPCVGQSLPVTPEITSPGDTGPDTAPKPEPCLFCQLPGRDMFVLVPTGRGVRGRNLPQVAQQCGGTAEVSCLLLGLQEVHQLGSGVEPRDTGGAGLVVPPWHVCGPQTPARVSAALPTTQGAGPCLGCLG